MICTIWPSESRNSNLSNSNKVKRSLWANTEWKYTVQGISRYLLSLSQYRVIEYFEYTFSGTKQKRLGWRSVINESNGTWFFPSNTEYPADVISWSKYIDLRFPAKYPPTIWLSWVCFWKEYTVTLSISTVQFHIEFTLNNRTSTVAPNNNNSPGRKIVHVATKAGSLTVSGSATTIFRHRSIRTPRSRRDIEKQALFDVRVFYTLQRLERCFGRIYRRP